MKKYISFIISFVILICTVAVSVAADDTELYPNDGKINRIGRCAVGEDNSVSVGYGLTELNFNVKASGVKCLISTGNGETQAPYFAVYINGKFSQKLEVKQGENWYTLASGISASKVTNIRLVKTNERWMAAKITKLSVSGEVVAPTPAKSRLIEVVGDSISAGYGILTSDNDAADDVNTDATYSYVKILADKMGAQVNLIANSGRGIYANSDGSTKDAMPTLYDKLLPGVDDAAFDHSSVNPDIIIVNLGTNDSFAMKDHSEITEENITDAAKNFTVHLREVHPKAYIVWTYGLMNSNLTPALENAVSELSAADNRICFIPLPYLSEFSDGFGKGWHPDIAANRGAADYLFDKLTEMGIIGSDTPGYMTAAADSDWEYDTSKMPGDANNDYEVNVIDLVRMKKYSADTASVGINAENADYNLDGKIDAQDLVYLRKDLLKN